MYKLLLPLNLTDTQISQGSSSKLQTGYCVILGREGVSFKMLMSILTHSENNYVCMHVLVCMHVNCIHTLCIAVDQI